MKKMALVAAFLIVSTFSFNGFAKEEASEEVTVRELIAEGATMSMQAALIFGWFKYAHDYVKPVDEKSPKGLTFDIGFKGFCAAAFGNKAKSFFEKLTAFIAQQAKPLTDPALETIESAL